MSEDVKSWSFTVKIAITEQWKKGEVYVLLKSKGVGHKSKEAKATRKKKWKQNLKAQ
jgi:hypothetical protein